MSRKAADPDPGSYRTQRLKWAWLLALPFLLLADPDPSHVLAGGLLTLLGLSLRGWAAGSIHKERELATGGPYRFIRHPLYLGSLMMGSGLLTAARAWLLFPLYLALFIWIYGRTIRAEERVLSARFGEAYVEYRRQVPGFLPRVGRLPSFGGTVGFRTALYRRNREWQAALGGGLAFGILCARMVLWG